MRNRRNTYPSHPIESAPAVAAQIMAALPASPTAQAIMGHFADEFARCLVRQARAQMEAENQSPAATPTKAA